MRRAFRNWMDAAQAAGFAMIVVGSIVAFTPFAEQGIVTLVLGSGVFCTGWIGEEAAKNDRRK